MKIAGAILIRGPKWCGKTTTCKQRAKSYIELQDEDIDEENSNALKLAELKPSLLLEGEKPRLIDEWQLAPNLWNTVRHSVDETGKKGQYLLTGSATPNEKEDKSLHSGAGRFAFLDMKTMSWLDSIFYGRYMFFEVQCKNKEQFIICLFFIRGSIKHL